MSRKKRNCICFIGIGFILCIIVCLLIFGLKKKWIFSLNGEKLCNKEVTIFGMIYTKEHNITNSEHLEEIKEENQTYGEYYKKQLEDDMISTVLLYKEAKDENVCLEKEDKKEIEKKTEELMKSYGKGFIDERNISESDIKKIYEMKILSNAYMEQFMNQKKKKEISETKDRYVKVYQVSFLTVVLDENGKMKLNEDGSVQKKSVDEVEKIEEEAKLFAKHAKDFESLKNLLKEYDNTVKGMEKYLKYDDLNASYKKAVDDCKQGEISDVIESQYGFYVIQIMEDNAKDYTNIIDNHQTNQNLQNEKIQKIEELYKKYIRDDIKYKNINRWQKISMQSFIKG